ncbi:Uncharacterised protein [Bordetella pertussis]|nr:Uncharacterised protein [Bordetella pertussis]CFM94634.1 Uncharacterised protein [Bordetella pertussis]CFO03483.1 Uncharacterised protein [Bordetella pertussis]CFO24876.1 Uncharacterised protein [Bordetella pertussis]CFO36701.1 Uncharacterised protein [Bordetella pertussis]
MRRNSTTSIAAPTTPTASDAATRPNQKPSAVPPTRSTIEYATYTPSM